MILTYKGLNRLEYPVYLLPSFNWDSADGLLFLDGVVLDDKNMPGETLGLRRLQTSFPVVPLNKAVNTALGIIKHATGQAYIDNIGRVFQYEKTTTAKLKWYKIRKIEKKKTFTRIWLANINFSFDVPRPPPPECMWAGVLHVKGFPWMLYSYSETKQKDTFRKI